MKKLHWIITALIITLLVLLVVIYIFVKLPLLPRVVDCLTPGSKEFQYNKPMDTRCIIGTYTVDEVVELERGLRGRVIEVVGNRSNSTIDTFATYFPFLIGKEEKIYLSYSINESIDTDYDGLISCIGVYRYNFILRTHHLDPASCQIRSGDDDNSDLMHLKLFNILPTATAGEFDPYNVVLPNGEPLRSFMFEHDSEI